MRSNLVELLRHDSEQFLGELDQDPLVGRVLRGEADHQQYQRFLIGSYQYVRWSGYLLARTASSLSRTGRCPELTRVLEEKAKEEGPHDQWLLRDLRGLGANIELIKGMAVPVAIEAYVAASNDDRARANQPLPSDLCFVVHPRLERGREVYLRGVTSGVPVRKLATPGGPGEQFELSWAEPKLISNYRDPLAANDQPWLAAFAPVGQTGYVVLVQTTRHAVLAGSRSLSRKLFVNAGIPLALGIGIMTLLARLSAQRRKRLKLRLAPLSPRTR